MAETTRTVLVCDLCGKLATGLMNFYASGSQTLLQVDICDDDMADLQKKAHKPRRGRRPGVKAKTRS